MHVDGPGLDVRACHPNVLIELLPRLCPTGAFHECHQQAMLERRQPDFFPTNGSSPRKPIDLDRACSDFRIPSLMVCIHVTTLQCGPVTQHQKSASNEIVTQRLLFSDYRVVAGRQLSR